MKAARHELAPAERRRVRAILSGLALLAALATYVWIAFSARERARAASPELAELLAAGTGFERVLWIASPHQNLGALDERVGDLELYLEELSKLSGIPRPRLPRFGPFSLPPAKELVLAWNGSGESFLGVARIEAGIGLAARLSGRLAGNPWLSGGRVESHGRQFDVRWHGGLWIVASGLPDGFAWPPPGGTPSAPGVRPAVEPIALAQLVLRHGEGPLPAGRYILARGATGLEVRAGVQPPPDAAVSDWSFPGVSFWMSASEPGPVGGPGLFLVWDAAKREVPRVAVLQRGGGQIFRLPGEKLLRLVGQGEPAFRLGWSVRATQKSAQRESLLLVPWLERNLPRAGGRAPWPSLAGRLVPGAAARTLARLAEDLSQLPILPPAEVERLAAGARLLAPFQECAAIAFEVWREPDGARLRLCAPPSRREAAAEELSSVEDGEIDEEAPIR